MSAAGTYNAVVFCQACRVTLGHVESRSIVTSLIFLHFVRCALRLACFPQRPAVWVVRQNWLQLVSMTLVTAASQGKNLAKLEARLFHPGDSSSYSSPSPADPALSARNKSSSANQRRPNGRFQLNPRQHDGMLSGTASSLGGLKCAWDVLAAARGTSLPRQGVDPFISFSI